jgi:aconitate hydratase
VRLEGRLAPWVSAKDVVLEMLRRHGVEGGVGRILEYYGPGVGRLSAMDRHVIANMGAELGATTTVFPSDAAVREFLVLQGRSAAFVALSADEGARYDFDDTIELGQLEPLIARPSSPGNVVPVREVEGEPIYQAYVGSSANPGFRDFAVAACMVRGRQIAPSVSFDVNPTSRQLLHQLSRQHLLEDLLAAGARIHQAGCNGCIGMGQAPATGRSSLRTTPRNFPGRSGARDDSVWLCSPETATASALAGHIADPRRLGEPWFEVPAPRGPLLTVSLEEPPPAAEARTVALEKGPNIVSLPQLDPAPPALDVAVVLALGDDVSTDTIMPAGARVLPFRSNIPSIAEFCFEPLARELERPYVEQVKELAARGEGHAIVAGRNYGQGSSREHAALAPRYLGLRVVLALSYARIHRANLINYGVLPLVLCSPEDRTRVAFGDHIRLDNTALASRSPLAVTVARRGEVVATLTVDHFMTLRDIEIVRAGGKLTWMRERLRRT